MSDALKEVKHSCESKNAALSVGKLAGKSLFNFGLFAEKIGVEVIRNIPDQMAKNAENNLRYISEIMADEQIENNSKVIKNFKGKKLF